VISDTPNHTCVTYLDEIRHTKCFLSLQQFPREFVSPFRKRTARKRKKERKKKKKQEDINRINGSLNLLGVSRINPFSSPLPSSPDV
jgi:hypothetical protein